MLMYEVCLSLNDNYRISAVKLHNNVKTPETAKILLCIILKCPFKLQAVSTVYKFLKCISDIPNMGFKVRPF
uniref:Uncharacterized protein n=1 Tax=Arion vulgaris TaxID=1028688 RepID=A0A0B7ALI9_9EUPU